MSVLFQLPKQVVVTSAGRPFPGAKAHFYLTGTTTETNVYQDSSLSTAHANPVVADSAGVFPAIYLDPDVTYKLTLTQSNDTLIYTVDPVSDSLTAANIGKIIYPRTPAEISAGVTPVDYRYPELNVLRYGTNTTPGTTDMTDAIQAAIDVAYARGGGVVEFPHGHILAQTDTIGVPKTVGLRLNQCTLKALSGFPETISSDKFGGTSGFTFDAPQIWFDCRLSEGGAIINAADGYLDGNDVAPCGLVITLGANDRLDTIYAFDHTVANFVFDGPQNSHFSNLRARAAPKNYRYLNVTQLCQFVNCNGNEGTTCNAELEEDSDFPSYRAFSGVQGPARNQWLGGILENFSESKERTLYVSASSTSNRFRGTNFVGECTIAGVETGSSSLHTVFDDCFIWGGGSDVPALILRGFRNAVLGAHIHDWGDASLVDLIECYGRSRFERIFWGTNTISGKHVANKSASPTDPQLITFIHWPAQGGYASRPTEDIDAYALYFDTTSDTLIVWDFNADTWQQAGRVEFYTAASIGDADHAVNTQLKTPGKMIWDTTNGIPLWSSGSDATSAWTDEINSGSGSITPS